MDTNTNIGKRNKDFIEHKKKIETQNVLPENYTETGCTVNLFQANQRVKPSRIKHSKQNRCIVRMDIAIREQGKVGGWKSSEPAGNKRVRGIRQTVQLCIRTI